MRPSDKYDTDDDNEWTAQTGEHEPARPSNPRSTTAQTGERDLVRPSQPRQSHPLISPSHTIHKKRTNKTPTVFRGNGFGQAEIDHLLGVLDHYLPLCKDEWDTVLTEHEKLFRNQQRTTDSLRRKFATMHRKKMPTGDPMIPADVKRAKYIKNKMTERADMGVMDSDDGENHFPSEGDVETAITNTQLDDTPNGSDEFPEAEETLESPIFVPSVPNRGTSVTTTPAARSIVGKRRMSSNKNDDGDLISILQAQILQDGIRREEERRQREEDRQMRRESEVADQKRHERMMEMMMMVLCRGSGVSSQECDK